MSTKDIIRGMREIASHVLPKGAEVILFGSRARGDARVDSDWDILILIDGGRATCEDFEKFAYPFVDYGWSVGEQINPLIYSFEDWSKRSITPFYKNVQLEGVSLCR
ncbi:MAG: nucleotidyltransferase domain-containing protein [Candidatus Cryptobacteroides sp.]|nr:nucleotidyltransferase domain-containing protein [Candidatus Cryptobacteroides sp.]